jgi:hypothetical protein
MSKYAIILISSLLFYGCKKETTTKNTPSDIIKITLVSGSNQTAAIGYTLVDSIVVKVTKNGAPASSYNVEFIGSGCNKDLITELQTKTDGTVKYSWQMASDQGLQTLKAVAIVNNQRVDSITVNATATKPVGLPARSACTPSFPETLVELSTGRIIACFYTKTSIRYSDDEGVSWHPLTGFGASHSVSRIAVSPQDEIFVAADDGIFYSKDAGTSWANITPPSIPNPGFATDLAYTLGGKLLFSSSVNNAVYTSADKGKTWVIGTGLPTPPAFGNFVELLNGDLYLVSYSNILFKSTDIGKTWTAQTDKSTEAVMSIYVDNNGWFYKAANLFGAQQPPGEFVISKDNGATFTNFLNFSPGGPPYVTNISIQPDGYMYFDELAHSIARVYNANLIADNYALTGVVFPAYIATKTGRFMFAANGGITYY